MNNRFSTEHLTIGMSSYLLGRVVDHESAPALRMMKKSLNGRKSERFFPSNILVKTK